MKLATVRIDGGTRCARIEGAETVLLPFADLDELLAGSTDWRQRAAATIYCVHAPNDGT